MYNELNTLFDQLSLEFRLEMLAAEFKRGWPETYQEYLDDNVMYCMMSI